jgi:flavodoxin
MKTLIIYMSYHHQNTEKIAKAMAEELGADVVPVAQAHADALAAYDLIGFGSGIYFWKFHEMLLQFVESLPAVTGTRAFIFSTAGRAGTEKHAAFKELVASRGFLIVGEFSCEGYNTYGPLRLVGGRNKGRPNEEDLAHAREFAHGLKEEST